MNINTPYRIMMDLIQDVLCKANGHAKGATEIYNEIVKPLQEAAAPSGEGEKMAEGWTDETVLMYAEIYRWSSTRVSIKQFREMQEKGEWIKPLKERAVEIAAEWKENEELRAQLEAGKAPESAWDWNELLQEFLNFSLEGYKSNHDIFNWFKAKIQSNK